MEPQEVLTSLRDGDRTLVEIVEYKVFRPFRLRSETWGESRYIAYALFADGGLNPKISVKPIGSTRLSEG